MQIISSLRLNPRAVLCAAAVALLALAASPAQAILTDTLTGQTPGHLIGGTVKQKTPPGGPDIPLAPDTVAADGTVSFVKPDVSIESITYIDNTTGKTFQKLTTTDNSAVDLHLIPGDRYPIFHHSFFDVFFEIQLNEFDNTLILNVGDTFQFNGGAAANLAGVALFESFGGNVFTGSIDISGFNVVSAPEPATIALLGLGLAGLGWTRRRRRAG
jgi:hypothetical protein